MRYRGLITLGIVAALVLVLEAVCRAGGISRTILLPPSEIAVSLYQLLRSGEANQAILVTFGNIVISALISILAGFVIGLIVHASRFLRDGLEPFLTSYYAVPTFIFYPVFIVLFGVGSRAIIAIAVLMGVVAMITATLNGLDRLPRVLTRTAQIMQMSPLKTAVLVQLPATAPYLFTGARLAIAYAFIGVIASEFVLAGEGLGYEIAYAYNNFENRTMYALMLLVILAVIIVNTALDLLDRRLQARLRR
jgi:NitT/TauT family transport system permease protein